METGVYELIRHTQAAMVGGWRSRFPELDDVELREIVRLVEKFNDEICLGAPYGRDVEYWCASIWSATDAFLALRDSYRLMSDTQLSLWTEMTAHKTIEAFQARYKDFHADNDFERKLGLLLDLFKLQIVWAAFSYR